ncbi:Tetratricopeptide repeat protein 28 [Stylophora pistillata]|uniref:Tetratricopeptide repeat protein 28 n=1 Tax=Stylophora pistillata TaxID=50429 RepID=A0A2B4R5M1_STYPI|nr:Tetratricopeptide repeat protein 28 [Stylophora pistillata]
MDNIEEVLDTTAVLIALMVPRFLLKTGRVSQAIELCKECLIVLNSQGLSKDGLSTDSSFLECIYILMDEAYDAMPNDYANKEKYLKDLLLLHQDSGDTFKQGRITLKLADTLNNQSKFVEARKYYQLTTNIMNKNGDKQGIATCQGNLATVHYSLGEYDKCKNLLVKALAIKVDIGDKEGEATEYGNLGTVFQSLGNYETAQEYHKKALAIRIEIGDKEGEATDYGNLGTLFRSLGNYEKAQEYHKKALAIRMEIGDKKGEAADYGNLGIVFQSLGNFETAQEYYKKALAITMEIGEKKGEAADYGNLGTVFQSLGNYETAQEYHKKALAIRMEIGDKQGEATDYGNLGTVFQWLANYETAQEYYKKALAIRMEIGDKKGEAAVYGNLGTLFESLGNYETAHEYHKKALAIRMEIGDKKGEASVYGNLGTLFFSLGEHDKAQEYLQKALHSTKKIGDREGKASCFGNLGVSFLSLEYEKAQEYYQKALPIFKEIGHRRGEVVQLANLGACFTSLNKCEVAEEYFKKALSLSKNIGLNFHEFQCLYKLTKLKLSQVDQNEAFLYLFQCIEKFDALRGFLKDNDHFKTSLLEEHGTFPYKLLSNMLSSTGNPNDALYVEELRRARGPADLIAAKYSVKEQISGNPQSWQGIQNIITKETDCSCLYISIEEEHARYWILKATGAIHFSRKKVSLEKRVVTQLVPSLEEFFTESFLSLGILPQQNCEDRSLDDTESISTHCENRELMRDYDPKDFKSNLISCYDIIIAPVADLLKKPEIIIVPESCMYQVPHEARKWLRKSGFDKVSQWATFILIGDNVTFEFGTWPVSKAPQTTMREANRL